MCYANKRTGATTGAWPGRPGLLRLEGLGLERKGRLRTVLRRAVHAGAEPHRDSRVDATDQRTSEHHASRLSQDRGAPARPQGAGDRPAGTRQWTSPCYIKEYPLVVSRGAGAMVEDVDGNRYLDFMAGIAVSSTGYGHPKVVAAVKEAADRFLHICGSDFYYEGMAALCERLGAARAGPVQEAGLPDQLRHRGGRRRRSSSPATRPGAPRSSPSAGAFHGRTHRRGDA